jgi:hypothetical protein
MLEILRQYIDGDYQVTEYTKNGQTISHVVKVPVQTEVLAGEQIPVPPTFEQRIKALEDTILTMLQI